MTCDWCGHEHAQTALCAKRPTWGRRGFLQLLGAAALGAMLPATPDYRTDVAAFARDFGSGASWCHMTVQTPDGLVSFFTKQVPGGGRLIDDVLYDGDRAFDIGKLVRITDERGTINGVVVRKRLALDGQDLGEWPLV